jgi:hypothetical protein
VGWKLIETPGRGDVTGLVLGNQRSTREDRTTMFGAAVSLASSPIRKTPSSSQQSQILLQHQKLQVEVYNPSLFAFITDGHNFHQMGGVALPDDLTVSFPLHLPIDQLLVLPGMTECGYRGPAKCAKGDPRCRRGFSGGTGSYRTVQTGGNAATGGNLSHRIGEKMMVWRRLTLAFGLRFYSFLSHTGCTSRKGGFPGGRYNGNRCSSSSGFGK